MCAFGHGRQASVYQNGYDMSNYLNSVTHSASVDTHETTVFSSTAKTYLVGLVDGSLSAEGLFSSTGIDSTLNTLVGSTAGSVWSEYPQSSAVGSYGMGMAALNTAYEITTPVDGVVSLSVEGQSKMGRERIVSLRAKADASTSGTGTSNDNTAASTEGGSGYLHRFDTNSRTATIVVQHSSAGSSWATLLSFAATTGRNGQRVPVSGSVKRYVRHSLSLSTNSTAAVNFQVGFYRK